jgi:hypothetical protein
MWIPAGSKAASVAAAQCHRKSARHGQPWTSSGGGVNSGQQVRDGIFALSTAAQRPPALHARRGSILYVTFEQRIALRHLALVRQSCDAQHARLVAVLPCSSFLEACSGAPAASQHALASCGAAYKLPCAGPTASAEHVHVAVHFVCRHCCLTGTAQSIMTRFGRRPVVDAACCSALHALSD